MALHWRGSAVKRNVRKAQVTAIDTTMAACVLSAKENHGEGAHAQQRFETQEGSLERSVRIVDAARAVSSGARGRWGSTDTVYAHRIEMGFQGKDALGRVVDAPAYPYLIPAANDEYQKLAGRIRRAMR